MRLRQRWRWLRSRGPRRTSGVGPGLDGVRPPGRPRTVDRARVISATLLRPPHPWPTVRRRTCPPRTWTVEVRATTDGSRVYCAPIDEGGAHLLSRQHRHGYAADLHRGLRPRRYLPTRSRPPTSPTVVHCKPAPIRQVSSRFIAYGTSSMVPSVRLLVLLAGPAPSGSTGTSRRCQGCSHPPRRPPDQAAPSFTQPLRRPSRAGLSPPLGNTAPRGARSRR